MKFKVVMKDEAYDELFTLMACNKELNNGNEIGAWMLGNWESTDEEHKLLIDKFVIPKQKVSSVEVDISPESIADTVKELGRESNRIKAHWHIHPFGNGMPNWSHGDEQKFQEFMEPDKQRKIFVFLLSSFDTLKARVEINMKSELLGKPVFVQRSIDNLPVERENPVTPPPNPYFEKLKLRIAEKVETHKIEPMKYPTMPARYDDFDKEWYKKDTSEEDWIITKNGGKNGRVHLKMTEEFSMLVESSMDVRTKLLHSPQRQDPHGGHTTWKYDVSAEYPSVDDIEKQLKEDLEMVEASFAMDDYEEKRGSFRRPRSLDDQLFPQPFEMD